MIARDEERGIGRALASVDWADEIVVIDGGSEDRTPEVARAHGARVVEAGWPGYAAQRRRALREAAGPWALMLDADEEVTEELGREIRRRLAGDPPHAGYELPFLTRYLGRWMGARGWHRERHLRLVRLEDARVEGSRVHERLEVDGSVGRLEGFVRHHSYADVGEHVRRMADYAELKAERNQARGRDTTLPGAFGHGAAAFARAWIGKARIVEGWAGLAWSVMAGCATLTAYLRLWEMNRSSEP